MPLIPPEGPQRDRGPSAPPEAGRHQHRWSLAARRRGQHPALQPADGRAAGAHPRADARPERLRRARRAGQDRVRPTPRERARGRSGPRRHRDHVRARRRVTDLVDVQLAAGPRRRRHHHRLPPPVLRLHAPARPDRHPGPPRPAALHRAGHRGHRQLGVGRRHRPHRVVRGAVPDLRRRPGALPRRPPGVPRLHPPRGPALRRGGGGRGVRRGRRLRMDRADHPRRRPGAVVPRPGPGGARPRRLPDPDERRRPGHHRPGHGRTRAGRGVASAVAAA